LRKVSRFQQFRNVKAAKVIRHLADRPSFDGSVGCSGSGVVIFPGYRLIFTNGFAELDYQGAGLWNTYGPTWHGKSPRRRPRLPRARWMSQAGRSWDAFFEGPGADLGDRGQPDVGHQRLAWGDLAGQIQIGEDFDRPMALIDEPDSVVYIGYLRQDNLGRRDFGVEFPDLPGCVTAAWPLEEVPFMAVEALAGHVASLIDAGDPVPAPSTYDQLKDDPELAGAVMILVPLVLA
jgi:predicted RNase H-like HicB family nuclease